MKKRIVVAAILLLPCLLAVSEGHIIYNIIGLGYILSLLMLSTTMPARRFIRRLYRDILRAERRMSA